MEVEKIKLKPTIMADGKRQDRKLKVAAYCRVSTDTEDQMNSYNSQKEYYLDLIKNNPNYTLVGIYADPGISGTSTQKRDEFKRLIQDAKEGKIDLIMTKSISRFARNTLDTLKYVRELKAHNVSIKFEEENINTLSMDGELMLTILSSVAQQEVQNISANVKKGLDMKMQRGELIGYNGCLGYDYHSEDKSLTINEEEAKIVKYIFQRYLDGYGARCIAKELSRLGYKTKKGSAHWTDTTVLGILKNEKYKGDLLLGKTYTTDPISKRRVTNNGIANMYLVRNHHKAIIEPEMFDKVQELNKKKSNCFGRKNNENEPQQVYKRKYALTGICHCSYCGSRLFRRVLNSGAPYSKHVWQCTNHVRNGSTYCPDSRAITEEVIEKAFVEAFNNMSKNKLDDIDDFIMDISESLEQKDYTKELSKLRSEINKLENKKNNLMEMRLDGVISKEEFNAKLNEINNLINSKRNDETAYAEMTSTKDTFKDKALEFKNILENSEVLDSFDRTIFESSVERVMIGDGNDSNTIIFVFKTSFTTGERVFNNSRDAKNVLNCELPFVSETKEQQEKSLELLNSNVKELFSFEINYEHYTFIPNQYDEGTRNKILKHVIPVKVLITTE